MLYRDKFSRSRYIINRLEWFARVIGGARDVAQSDKRVLDDIFLPSFYQSKENARGEDARDSHRYFSSTIYSTFVIYVICTLQVSLGYLRISKNIVYLQFFSLIVSETSFDSRLQLARFSQDFPREPVYKAPVHELKRGMFLSESSTLIAIYANWKRTRISSGIILIYIDSRGKKKRIIPSIRGRLRRPSSLYCCCCAINKTSSTGIIKHGY